MSTRIRLVVATAVLATLAGCSTIVGKKESIALYAPEATEELKSTLVTTHGAVDRLDRDVIARMPAMMDKLDRTLSQLESTANNANGMIAENRAPLANGMQQLGPTLTELRSLVRDLRRVAGRLDSNPAGYVLGRQQPKEFVPK